MSRPINKLKSHIFFTCKYFLVPDFTGKKNFAPENRFSTKKRLMKKLVESQREKYFERIENKSDNV